MSVKELQALTQKFADAFDQRDLQPILDMLSEDVEVFDHVPYRFDGKALFAKYLNKVTWRCTMTIHNPLADHSPDHEDQSLVLRARSGDHQALEELVQRHQTWIYNIAIRMLHHPQDAEDATQEILIKVLTRLSSFEGRSSFRTWLYRIVVNHVLNMRRGRVEVQHESIDFASYGAALDA